MPARALDQLSNITRGIRRDSIAIDEECSAATHAHCGSSRVRERHCRSRIHDRKDDVAFRDDSRDRTEVDQVCLSRQCTAAFAAAVQSGVYGKPFGLELDCERL